MKTPELGLLEQISLWYNYKTKVWGEKTSQAAAVHNIMRVLRSIHNIEDLGYISTPVTTGENLYRHLMKKDPGPYPYILQQTMDENYTSGYLFLEHLRSIVKHPLILPSDMVAARQEWEQPHYMALWLSIISEKTTKIYMNNGWEYANGSTEELTHGFQLRLGLPTHKDTIFFNTKQSEEKERERMRHIKIYDAKNNEISLEQALKMIHISADWVEKNGFDAKTLRLCENLLKRTKTLLAQGFYQ